MNPSSSQQSRRWAAWRAIAAFASSKDTYTPLTLPWVPRGYSERYSFDSARAKTKTSIAYSLSKQI
jgi:hypothetical protein